MKPNFFAGSAHIAPAISHQTGGSARSGDRVNMENYHKVGILLSILQASASTTAITVDISTAATGGSSKTGISLANWWKMEDVTVGTTADTWTKGTAATSITSSSAGAGTSYYYIEIDADECYDSGTNYPFVELKCGTSNSGNYLNAVYLMLYPRYGQATMLTAQS